MSIRPPKMWIATRLGRSSHVSSQGLETDWSPFTRINFNENSAGWMIYISKTTCCCHNDAKEHMYCFRKHVSGVWPFLVPFSILFWATLVFGSFFFSFCLQIWCWSKSNVGLSSVLMKLASSCDIDAKIWHRLLMNS